MNTKVVKSHRVSNAAKESKVDLTRDKVIMSEQANTNFDTDPYDDDYSAGAVDQAPVLVHVKGTDVVSVSKSAEYGSWQTYLINATWTPNQILKRNLRRSRAVIICGYTTAAQPNFDGVILGTQQQAQGSQTLADTLGGFMPVGTTITIENQQELWAAFPVANTDPVRLLVLDELYAAAEEDKSGK